VRNRKPQLRENFEVGTDWEALLEETEKSSIPIFLIKEVHFITPGQPDVVMPFDNLDQETLALLSRSIQDFSNGPRIRLIIDLNKYQRCIEQIVSGILDDLLP